MHYNVIWHLREPRWIRAVRPLSPPFLRHPRGRYGRASTGENGRKSVPALIESADRHGYEAVYPIRGLFTKAVKGWRGGLTDPRTWVIHASQLARRARSRGSGGPADRKIPNLRPRGRKRAALVKARLPLSRGQRERAENARARARSGKKETRASWSAWRNEGDRRGPKGTTMTTTTMSRGILRARAPDRWTCIDTRFKVHTRARASRRRRGRFVPFTSKAARGMAVEGTINNVTPPKI